MIDLWARSTKIPVPEMEDGGFKTCQFCQEKIRAMAIKCRFCGEFLQVVPPALVAPESSFIEIEGRFVGATDPAPQAVAKPANYFRKHWIGEYSLGRSCWVTGFGLGLLLMAVLYLATPLYRTGSLAEISLPAIVLYGASLAVFVWQIGGAWRSAGRHAERDGKPVWANVAKAGLVLAALGIAHVAVFTMVPQVVESAIIRARDWKVPAYEIRPLPDETEIEFTGGLRPGATRALDRILRGMPQVKTLRLNSPGGGMREANEMASLVTERGLKVQASEQCLDAAVLVFLAARERSIETNARVGFEQVDFPGITGALRQQFEIAALDVFREAGVKKEFATRALTAPRDQMWFPSVEEMRLAGVLSDPCPELVPGKSAATEEDNRPWMTRTLFKRVKELEPTLYMQLLDEVFAGIKKARTRAETTASVRGLVAPLLEKYLPTTSDEGVLAVRDYWLEVLAALKDTNAIGCLAIVTPRVPVAASIDGALPDWVQTRGLNVMEKVLSDAGTLEVAPASPEALDDAASTKARLVPRFGEELTMLASPDKWPENPRQICDILEAVYRETQALTPRRQANLVRYFASQATAAPR